MHAIEKILAKAAGRPEVTTGEIVNCQVDLAGINDLYLQTIRSFVEMGGQRVHDPEKLVVFFDHYAPASTILQADNQKKFREFCREQDVPHLMDINQGVCHQVLADQGLVRPGMIVVVTDSHTTTHGAFGAFGTGVGATDLATIMISGELWFRVPEIVRIQLTGSLMPGVFAKDIILKIIGDLGADYGVYKAIEFTGPTVAELSIAERMTLCNMTTELGAKTSYIQPDEITLAYLKDRQVETFEIFNTDPDYHYSAEHIFDVSALRPQAAAPSSVDNVYPVSDLIGRQIDQAFLGTCTGGRVSDLEVAARILKGKKINPGTRLVVVPASKKVLLEAIEKGYFQTLIEAGATMVTPGCAACLGIHQGMLAAGESCITSSSRNFPGRMGDIQAEIYVASPAAVAAAALAGEIVDPTPFFKEGEEL